jgi:hypothetical protein
MDSKSGCRPITHQTHAHMSIESDQNRMPDLMACKSSPKMNHLYEFLSIFTLTSQNAIGDSSLSANACRTSIPFSFTKQELAVATRASSIESCAC